MHPRQPHPPRRRRSPSLALASGSLPLLAAAGSLALLGSCTAGAPGDAPRGDDTSSAPLRKLSSCEDPPLKIEDRLLGRLCQPNHTEERTAATIWLVVEEAAFKNVRTEDPVALWESISPEFRRIRQQFVDRLAADYPDVHVVPDHGIDDPFVTVIAPGSDLLRLATEPGVANVTTSIDESEAELEPAASHFNATENFGWLNLFGIEGNGVTVSVIEGEGYWDSVANLSGYPTGSCIDIYNTHFACSDPTLAPIGAHPRAAASIIRNSVPSVAEAAPEVTLIKGASEHGLVAATNWSLTQGARVFNRSTADPGHTAQKPHELYTDYIAMWHPYAPVIAASAGNKGVGNRVGHRLHNGLIVGGSDDSPIQDTVAIWNDNPIDGSQSVNTNGTKGWELPHLVAQAKKVDWAGAAPGTIGASSGTSWSAPQVAGAAARILGHNPTLNGWNVAVMAGLMASAYNIDGPELDLADNVDDRDGAGLLDALAAVQTLAANAKRDGGNAPAQYGHDYEFVTPSSFPVGTWHPEIYYAYVPAGKTLKIASVMFAPALCSDNTGPCPASPIPLHWLHVTAPGFTKVVGNTSQGYQFAAIKNTTGTDQTYTIRLIMTNWAGAHLSKRGLAWHVRG